VPLVVECDRMLRELTAPVGQRRGLLYETLTPSLARDEEIAIRRADLALAVGEFEAGLTDLTDKSFHPGEGRFDSHRLFSRLSLRLGERRAGQGDWAAAGKLWRQSMEFPENMAIGRPKRVHEAHSRYLVAMALEKQGDGPGARAELETLVPLCLRGSPVEAYFGILALRKLGRAEQAGQWLAVLARQADERSHQITLDAQFWATVTRAMLERANGNRQACDELLSGLKPCPSDDIYDFLVTGLY
jgi:hypothetical protein